MLREEGIGRSSANGEPSNKKRKKVLRTKKQNKSLPSIHTKSQNENRSTHPADNTLDGSAEPIVLRHIGLVECKG
jgi:hypothetical protein